MKALLYTATSLFIVMAGVIAFYAVQTPETVGGAKIVLDIDASAMPAIETSAEPRPEPYADAQENAQAEAAPANNPSANSSAPETTAQIGSEYGAAAQDGRLSTEGTAASLNTDSSLPALPDTSSDTSARNPAETLGASSLQAFDLPPGTNLEPQTSAASGARPEDGLRGSAAAPAPQGQPDGAAADVAAAAAREAEALAAAQLPPPPPVPVRRPADIPAPGERLASAEGWGGAQFATTEVAAPKPARVGVLVRGLGRGDQESLDAVSTLPSAVSLAFLPYASESRRLASEARARGHEVIVQLPLEPADYPQTNPGPETLLTTLPPEENANRLQALLRRFEGHSGVTNLTGGKMLQSRASLKPLLQEIKSRGLVYVGESNNSHATVRQIARELNLRYGAAQVTIDAQATPEAIDKQLQRLVQVARERGGAIGMASANAETIRQLREWSQTLAAQNITLVPVGALAQPPGSS